MSKQVTFADIMTEEQFNSLNQADFQEALSVLSTINMYNRRGLIPLDPKEGDMYMDNDIKTHVFLGGKWIKIG